MLRKRRKLRGYACVIVSVLGLRLRVCACFTSILTKKLVKHWQTQEQGVRKQKEKFLFFASLSLPPYCFTLLLHMRRQCEHKRRKPKCRRRRKVKENKCNLIILAFVSRSPPSLLLRLRLCGYCEQALVGRDAEKTRKRKLKVHSRYRRKRRRRLR